jgi:AcrR family transcriptional regulator
VTDVTAESPRRAPGRPRSEASHQAIIRATLELLLEVGYGPLTMEAVRTRAGVGKATIYRRWDSKEALILDTLRVMSTPIPAPDEGSVRDDLFAYMDAVIEHFAPGRGSDVLPHLIEASCYDEQLRASLDDYLRDRQSTTRLILHRGIERGELSPDVDVDLITDVILAPFFYRHLLTGAPVDRAFTHRLVEFALR